MLRVCRSFQLQPLLPFPQIPCFSSSYTIHKTDVLSKCTYGMVVRATACEGPQAGTQYAVKSFDKYNVYTRRVWSDVCREVSILSSLDHPRCVKLHGCVQTASTVYIVMELVQGLNLFDAILQRGYLGEADVVHIAHQILESLAYLHSKGLVHRDIKPENIIITRDLRNLKLIDFGFARVYCSESNAQALHAEKASGQGKVTPCYPPHLTPMDRGSAPGSTPCGTVSYAAPEVMRSVVNHRRLMAPWAELPKLDIFSAGVVVYVMLCGELPFSNNDILSFRTHQGHNEPKLGSRRWHRVSYEGRAVITRMLDITPRFRPGAQEVLDSHWLRKPRGMAVAAQRLVADTETVTELASMTQNPEFRLGMQMLARIDEQHPAATDNRNEPYVSEEDEDYSTCPNESFLWEPWSQGTPSMMDSALLSCPAAALL
jgi:serine/threonine protein kinase